jgi:hypothetical protein
MSTLNGKSVASTYDQVVKRQDSYSATGNQIEIMDDSGVIKTTPLYLDSVNSRVGIGTASPATALDVVGVIRASGGIQPNGNAYSASEVLDDYEEGTWTPVPARISTSITTTGTITASGRYTKIGRQVYISGYIAIDGTITQATNICTAGGLPFAPETDSDDRRSNQIIWDQDGQTALTGLNITHLGVYTDYVYSAVIFGANGPAWAVGSVRFSGTYKTAT